MLRSPLPPRFGSRARFPPHRFQLLLTVSALPAHPSRAAERKGLQGEGTPLLQPQPGFALFFVWPLLWLQARLAMSPRWGPLFLPLQMRTSPSSGPLERKATRQSSSFISFLCFISFHLAFLRFDFVCSSTEIPSFVSFFQLRSMIFFFPS